MQHIFRLLATALVLTFPMVARGQFKYFTTDNGLQSNTVKCLFQSSDDQVWAGTAKGVCRHNGIEFSEYGIENSQSFRSEVYSICESEKDRTIWLGCVDGLYRVDMTSMRIEKVDPYAGASEDIESGIRCLCMDNRGNLWIGSNGKGIHKYDTALGTCKTYPECSQGCIISRILMTSDNAVFFCSLYDDCLYRYAPARDEFVKIPIVDRFTKEKASKVVDFCQDSYGDIWIVDNNCTLFRLHPYDMQFVSYKSTLPKRISDVRVMIEHKKENLVIGTNVGLVTFDCNSLKFSMLDDGNIRNDGKLNDRFIYSLLRDKDSGLWVGTYFGGVNYKSPTCDIIKNVEIPDGCGEIISVMYETDKGNVLIGSDDGGLNRYDFNTREYRRIIFDPENPNLNIHCIYPDGDDLWIGTYGGGLYRLAKDFSVKKHYESTDITLGDLHVYSAYRDRSGSLWMGTPQGICKYNPENDEFMRTLYFDKGNDVTDILEWDGSIYFASQGKGLIRYNRASGDFEFLSAAPDLPKRVSTLEVFKSELYLGSYEGLYAYDGTSFSKKGNKQLSESNVASITADNNALWITTTNGLYCYWNDDLIARYGRESGLMSESFNTNSSIKLSNGDVLVGTERGLSTFKSAELTPGAEQRKVRTVITDFIVPKEKSGVKESRSCLEQIVIKSRAAAFSIHFSSLNYQNPKSSRFRYILEGNDKDWNYIEADLGHRDATYTSVKPGKYRFAVSATASETSQFGDETSLDIIVQRPLSSWLEIIASVAFILAALLIILRIVLNNRKVSRYLKSVRNAQIEKSLYESMLKEMIEETRNAIARLRMTLGSVTETSRDDDDPSGRIVANNIESLFSLVEKDAMKYKAISNGYGNISDTEQKADAIWVLQSLLETYKELARNAFNLEMNYTISDKARSLKVKSDVNTLSSRMRELMDKYVENSFEKVEVFVDAMEDDLEITVVSDGKKATRSESMTLKTDVELLESPETTTEPVLNRRFRKDLFNVIAADPESGFQSGEIRAYDTVFNVVVCTSPKEVEVGFSNYPVTAFICGQSFSTNFAPQVLQDLRKQYPSTLFITLSSSLDDTDRISDLHSFADLTLTRPVSIQLLANQIRSLLKLRSSTTTTATDESSILKKIEQSDNFTKSICEIIKQKIANPELSVGELAEAMNVSRATVFNRLKSSLNTTPNNLIRDIRLEIAAQMLTQGNVRVSDVYYKIGFTSGSYFSKLFHERYGISPKDYSR